MKKLLTILISFLLFSIPNLASTSGFTQSLGTLAPSNIILDLNTCTLETYQVFDTCYVPVSRLKDVGYDILYDPVTLEIKITSNLAHTPSDVVAPNLAAKPFSLYEGNIWLGNLRTHGIISENNVLIPIGALRELYQIEINKNHYTLIPKSPLDILVTQTQITNPTAMPASLSIVDIYWDDTWITDVYDYELLPNELIARDPLPANDTRLYLSTIVTKLENEFSTYANQNMHGQLNSELFTRFSRAKNGQNLSDLGDPIDLSSVIQVENIVNSKNLHSPTPYLVWTHLDSQKTYIFEGSVGNWKLIKHFICSTGRDYTPTPKGEFQLTRKVPYFGVEKGYRCKNAFGFIGTTYLYHSIIFDKTGSYLLEGKGVLGTKASQGCIRFSVENSEWFYNNMISGTKVWIS